ncbi:MAG: hypothetical protein OXH79_13285 [Boseongicola sp.]|nr:hypothetical protein [Boseongicola sp.]
MSKTFDESGADHAVRKDVEAALSAGILTEVQASRFLALVADRNAAAGDEPFTVFRGMNEIFIIAGLMILSFGWTVGVSALATGSGFQDEEVIPWACTAALLPLLFLSEYFIRRRRMVGPAIALALLFAINALIGIWPLVEGDAPSIFGSYENLPATLLLAGGALCLWWLRYRVPFAMAPIALAIVTAALVFAADRAETPTGFRDIFLFSATGPFAWITLAAGLGALAVALAFDVSDPHRVTRRAAHGFWLHIVAAPAIVNTVALSLLDAGHPAALFPVLALFAAFAVIIDRRSFLLASCLHVVALANAVTEGEGAWAAILGLGVVLLALGSFWTQARCRLVGILPAWLPRHVLPPVHPG